MSAPGSSVPPDARGPSPSAEESPARGPPLHRCGTLTYTRRGLVVLFAWLLWGDFCFNMMETVIPSILPLKLRSLGSANWLIALIMSTLPGVFNTTICPWVSFKSDHYRSRWGRRIPFILCTMPFLVASLLLIAYSDAIGGWLHGLMYSGGTVTRSMVIVSMLAVFAGMFDLFNMFVGSIYCCLYNDVVPEEFQSRFFGWSRLLSVAGVAVYNFFIFRFALSHMREIYSGAALLYLLGYGLMCLKVKEGEYPPSPDSDLKPSLLRDIRNFSRECFTARFYWYIFLATMFSAIGGTMGIFMVFYQQSMGLDLSLIGKLGAAYGIALAACFTFAGILADRWHPVRVDAYGNALNVSFVFVNLLWIFIDPPPSSIYFWVLMIAIPFEVVLTAVQSTTAMPRLMHLFPKGRFGAFCGAQALVRSAGTMIGGLLAGLFLDIIKQRFPADSLQPYRYVLVWRTAFAIVTFFFCYRIYRYWKRLGGDTGYAAPLTSVRYADLPKAEDSRIRRGMLIPMGLTWSVMLLCNAFYFFYFTSVAPNPRSAWFCGIVTALVLLGAPLFLRFLRFMERP